MHIKLENGRVEPKTRQVEKTKKVKEDELSLSSIKLQWTKVRIQIIELELCYLDKEFNIIND